MAEYSRPPIALSLCACALATSLWWATPTVAQSRSSAASHLARARIAELIEQLGDGNYHLRIDAQWELERIGLAAFEQLREAALEHANAHVARAARYLIESQNVVWWLDTDSLEVRDLLKNYNASKNEERDTVLQQLCERGSPDALLALGRLARFESNELRSKSAALYLMQAVQHKLQRTDHNSLTEQMGSELAASLRLTLEDSQRPASQWLTALTDDLSALPSLPTEHVERWRTALELELQQAAALTSAQTAASTTINSAQFEQLRTLELTLRLARWLGTWITDYHDRDTALALVRNSLAMIGSEPHSLLTASAWAIEAKLPELVAELAAKYHEPFAAEPQLGYYLAESYLQCGDPQAAQQAADAASAAVIKQLDRLKKLPNLSLVEIQANQHFEHAGQLADRGLYQWAEQQYLSTLELDSKIRNVARNDLAQLYWFGDDYEKAAAILKPLAEQAEHNPDSQLPGAPITYGNPALSLANYHFYSGLAALDRNELPLASTHLLQALEVEGVPANPDIVIAMQRLGDAEPYHEMFQSSFDDMSGRFRVSVLEAEQELSRATDRMSRARAGPQLAEECNQLAWLLSKCEMSPIEAINLSLRSLELKPDYPVYLDTLARCYFAAGQIDDAVRTQRRAVQFSPHERQMQRQLSEFEAALSGAQP